MNILDKNRFNLENVLSENFGFTSKQMKAILESDETKTKSVDAILSKLYTKTMKFFKKDYFKVVDVTKGNCFLLDGYRDLRKLANYFFTFNDDNRTQAVVNYISAINDACDILERYQKEFIKGYATNNSMTIMFYQSLVAGVVHSMGNFMAVVVDYKEDDNGNYRYSYKANIKEKKLTNEVVYKALINVLDLERNNKLAPFFKNASVVSNEQFKLECLYEALEENGQDPVAFFESVNLDILSENLSDVDNFNRFSLLEGLKDNPIIDLFSTMFNTIGWNSENGRSEVNKKSNITKLINKFVGLVKGNDGKGTVYSSGVKWTARAVLVIVAIIVVIILARVVIKLYYHSRLNIAIRLKQLSEDLDRIASTSTDISDKTREKQKEKAEKYKKYAEKFDIDNTICQKAVNEETQKENEDIQNDIDNSSDDTIL